MNAVASLNDRLALRARGTSSRYRIAMVAACPMPARRGTPLRIERLSHALWSRGHQVELITYHIADDQQPFEFPVHRIFGKPQYYQLPAGPTFRKLALYDPALAYKLWRVLANGKFDVIHAHHVEGLLAALPSRLHTKLPIVYDAHTMLASELPSYGPKRSRSLVQRFGSWFDHVLPRKADHVVAVTADIQSRLVDEQVRCLPGYTADYSCHKNDANSRRVGRISRPDHSFEPQAGLKSLPELRTASSCAKLARVRQASL